MSAVDDLKSAVADLSDAVTAEISALADAIAKQGVDPSAEIEQSVAKLKDLSAALKSSVTPAPAAAPVEPVVEPSPAPAETPVA